MSTSVIFKNYIQTPTTRFEDEKSSNPYGKSPNVCVSGLGADLFLQLLRSLSYIAQRLLVLSYTSLAHLNGRRGRTQRQMYGCITRLRRYFVPSAGPENRNIHSPISATHPWPGADCRASARASARAQRWIRERRSAVFTWKFRAWCFCEVAARGRLCTTRYAIVFVVVRGWEGG